jgi:hypothetical protein
MEPEELSTYRKTEEPKGIDRLFLSLASIYGKRWFDFWAGTDMETVKATWVRGLQGLQPYQVRDALDFCADGGQTYVPDLPAFRKICDSMKKVEVQKALPRKFNADDQLKNHSKMQEAMANLGGARGNKDWARKILANPKGKPEIAIKFAKEALHAE